MLLEAGMGSPSTGGKIDAQVGIHSLPQTSHMVGDIARASIYVLIPHPVTTVDSEPLQIHPVILGNSYGFWVPVLPTKKKMMVEGIYEPHLTQITMR